MARWKEIEEVESVGPPLQATIADSKPRDSLADKNKPWIKATLKTWQKAVKKHNLKGG